MFVVETNRQCYSQLIMEMTTETKRHRFDLVTNVDKQIQQQFQQFLATHFPEHQLLAEEKVIK